MPPSQARDQRRYHVVLFGATGFTGRLVAAYLAGETGRTTQRGHPKLVWAIAGRNESKLQAVKKQLKIDPSIAEEPDVLVADAGDLQELIRVTSQTRVVITTVGPFSLHGEPLVAACAKTGTDVVDSTGETPWVQEMIKKYSEQAEKSGCVAVSFCGFDSVPSDLMAYLAERELATKYNQATYELQCYQRLKGAGASGGTFASMINSVESRNAASRLKAGAHMLTPEEYRPTVTHPKENDQLFPRYDATIGAWTVPFV